MISEKLVRPRTVLHCIAYMHNAQSYNLIQTILTSKLTPVCVSFLNLIVCIFITCRCSW